MQGNQGWQVLSSLADRIIQDSESAVQAGQVEPVGKIRYRVVVEFLCLMEWGSHDDRSGGHEPRGGPISYIRCIWLLGMHGRMWLTPVQGLGQSQLYGITAKELLPIVVTTALGAPMARQDDKG